MDKILVFKGPVVTGELELNDSVLLSVPAKKMYNTIDLAFKCKGMNAGFAEICTSALDYENKVKLGAEIKKRWNGYTHLKSLLREVSVSEKNESFLNEELIDKIKAALME